MEAWKECQTAAESLSLSNVNVNGVDSRKQRSNDMPIGCFDNGDQNEVIHNTGKGGEGKLNHPNSRVICKKGDNAV